MEPTNNVRKFKVKLPEAKWCVCEVWFLNKKTFKFLPKFRKLERSRWLNHKQMLTPETRRSHCLCSVHTNSIRHPQNHELLRRTFRQINQWAEETFIEMVGTMSKWLLRWNLDYEHERLFSELGKAIQARKVWFHVNYRRDQNLWKVWNGKQGGKMTKRK